MKTSTTCALGATIFLFLPVLSACGGDDAAPAKANEKPAVEVPAAMFVSEPPSGAMGVQEARGKSKVGQEVVLHARIGGRKKPFVDGRALMVVCDTKLNPCSDEEGCPTPWDMCCETQEGILAHSATVQIVDGNGRPLAISLKAAHGLEPGREVYVTGKVSSTDGGMVVDARTIHVTAK